MDFREIKRILWMTLGWNLIVASAKILLGFFSGALSILSDGVHSLFDSFTNIAGLIGMKFAEKPADESHAYGHRKYEAIAAQLIFTFLVITSWELSRSIFEKISAPETIHPVISWFTFAVLICCLVIDALIARYEFRKGVELKSIILKTDSMHTKSHYVTTGSVLFGAILIKLGLPPIIDPLIAIIVVLFIANMAYEIFMETSAILSDKVVIDSERIRKIAESVADVKSCHQIRTRGDGNHVFLDIHIIVAPGFPLKKAHKICHLVAEKIQKEIPEVKDILVHPEPY